MKYYQSQSGFTLVELLVSLALFTVIAIAAVGSLYTVSQSSKKVNAMRTTLDNLDFATEAMSRTIRTADNVVCGGPLPQRVQGANCAFGAGSTGASELALDSTIGTHESLDYRLVNGSIEKCPIVGGTSQTGGVSTSSCVSITAPEVVIQNLTFFVDGASSNDGKQPGVMMIIEGVANAGADNTAPFSIQTYVSQRAGE